MRELICGCAIMVVLVAAPSASAQTVNGLLAGQEIPLAVAQPSDSLSTRDFAIREQELPDALAEFSRQAGISVVVEGDSLPRLRSVPIAGRMSPTAVLQHLLQGTGLVWRFVDERSVVVGWGGTATGGSGAHPLRRVVVRAVQSRPKQYSLGRSASATRTDTPLLDTPQSVSVVTSELIADQAMQSFSDVVRYVPGISMGTGEGHRDQPTIRGNNTTADFFVDGVRDDAQYFRDLYNVDRVEALKGPNAMIFGRGGGGGVINRVLKEAEWAPTRALRFEGGAHAHRRATLDLGGGFGSHVALRINGIMQRSGGFRDAADLERSALNPTAAFAFGARSTLRVGYEHMRDERRVDRGIPSLQGVPAPTGIGTFFGNPALNHGQFTMDALALVVEHGSRTGLSVRNRLHVADYDKYYQNTVPGSVSAAGGEVTLTAYSDAMDRRNVINQTDVVYHATTGRLQHTLLFGAELGRQRTERLRTTGFFNDATTSISVPFDSPTVATPVTFRSGVGSDPHSHSVALTAAAYMQDQVVISPALHVLLGLRHDRFRLRSDDHRTGDRLARTDNLLSPRVGVVAKPLAQLSLYGSHSISYLPGSGDQFTQLTPATRELEPERFTNREVGLKWDPARALSLSAALYRLDRTNTAAPDPNQAGRIVQAGGQRSSGFELGISGNVTAAWQVAGGYAAQKARITSTTSAASAGAIVPLVPERTFTLWNRYDVTSSLGTALGVVHQSEVFAGLDNRVTLPSFTRIDAALYVSPMRHLRVQANLENVLDRRYYPTAHNNNNIMPGAPRTLRLSLLTEF